MLHFIFVEHQSISYRITSSPVFLIQSKAFVLRTERTPTRWFLSSKDPPEFIYIEPLILTVEIMPLNTSLILVDYFFLITEESIVKLWKKLFTYFVRLALLHIAIIVSQSLHFIRVLLYSLHQSLDASLEMILIYI